MEINAKGLTPEEVQQAVDEFRKIKEMGTNGRRERIAYLISRIMLKENDGVETKIGR